MSLLESVKTAFQSKKKTSIEEYRKALAQGKPPEQIVHLALSAGLNESEIAEDIANIDKADALVESASKHPELKRALDDAVAKYASVEGAYAAAVGRFTEQLNAAGEEVETARTAESPSRKALQELTTLYREHADILPPAPPAILKLLDAQDREAALAASRAAVRQARAAAGEVERALLAARNARREPGIMSVVSGFNQKTMKSENTTIRQPVLVGVDDKHIAAEQASIARLENQMAVAAAAAVRLAEQHQERFGEQAP